MKERDEETSALSYLPRLFLWYEGQIGPITDSFGMDLFHALAETLPARGILIFRTLFSSVLDSAFADLKE
jgi:hypothetical protein